MITLFFLASIFSTAMAGDIYRCEAIIAASALPNGSASWSFETAVSEETHGGAPKIFREGAHEIELLANKQWLGISWMKEGKKIAQGVFVLGASDQANERAAILYDPSDSGDQVSLSCGALR